MSDPTKPAEPTQKFTFLDYALLAAEQFAENVLGSVQEVRSLAIVIDWAVPVGPEVTPGLMFARGPDGAIGPVAHPTALFGLMQQHARVGQSLSGRFSELLRSASETADNLGKMINERKRQLDELDARLGAAGAGSGPDHNGGGAAPAAPPGPDRDRPPGGD